MNRFTRSLILGTVITFLLFGAGYLTAENGMMDLSYMLYWQGYVLGMMVPCKEVVILGLANCEVTTVSIVAFYAGLPLGILVYSILSYVLLTLFGRRQH